MERRRALFVGNIDRLSRNPVDSGRISWLLQEGGIGKIVTHDRVYLPQDNVLIMSVEFGMANQFVRDLSVNTKRGLRAKAREGHFPGVARLGYLNDPRTKTIVVDRKKSKIMVAAFELYAQNRSRLEDVGTFLFKNGIKSKKIRRDGSTGDKPLKKDQIKKILTDPFYYGHFRYGGEMYEGRHKPIVSKELFDRVQRVLVLRGRVQRRVKEPKALCGLLKCGECGCAVTAETQKGHVYYRCSKKKIACAQPYVREEILDSQLSELLAKFHMPPHWAAELNRMAAHDAAAATSSTAASVHAMRAKIVGIDDKIVRLTDLFVEQDIERADYLERKRALMSDKKSLQERILLFERDNAAWLEPMRAWIKDASMLEEIANSKDTPSKKSSLQKIFGSNLILHAREARGVPQNQWFSLAFAKENHSETDLVPSLAPRVGFEPTTNSLTASCATIAPPRNMTSDKLTTAKAFQLPFPL